jgi:hypothetical protein
VKICPLCFIRELSSMQHTLLKRSALFLQKTYEHKTRACTCPNCGRRKPEGTTRRAREITRTSALVHYSFLV